MTPVFCCGFEEGVSGAHWTLNGATFTTSSPLSGTRSLLLNPSASTQNATTVGSFGAGVYVVRFRVRFSSLPTQSYLLCQPTGAFGSARFNAADGKIYAADSTGGSGTSGVSLATGVDYYIDFKLDTTSNPHLIDLSVNGTACAQRTQGDAANTTARTIRIGDVNNRTASLIIDDFVLSVTSADYPIGDGKGLSFVPNADGTHTGTSTHFKEGTAASPTGGASITSATTDTFNWVNARPIGGGATDATRLINQATAASAEYVEVDFEPTTELNAPQAVEVVTVDQQATTAVGDMHIKLNDNGTEDVILDRTNVAGVITDRYTTKQYATMVGGGAWTLARFNALKARFGYSADATPDQYWRGIMIEADFPVAAAASLVLPSLRQSTVQTKRKYVP